MQEKIILKRVITLPLLVYYGVGTMLGAGIYALSGKIAGISGIYTPVSFLISAIIASFVAFSYAELSGRYPKSAGEAVYVHQAFSIRWLTILTGWGVVFTGIISAGVMARGFHGYLNELIEIPSTLSIIFFVLLITFIALIGISLSIKFITLITLIEISGILLILYVTREHLYSFPETWQQFIPPLSQDIWQNIFFGAFLAFYAFIGFEDMVNVAEEIIDPEKNLPIGIIIALVLTTLFYSLIALTSVLSLPLAALANHEAPFALILQENSTIPAAFISLISLIAILNGAVIQIIMGSRVIYGMASQGIGPRQFKYIHPVTLTPTNATAFFALVLLAIAVWLPIVTLARITSFIMLSIFALVNLSLCIIKFKERHQLTDYTHMHVPFVIPVIGFFLCIGVILLQLR